MYLSVDGNGNTLFDYNQRRHPVRSRTLRQLDNHTWPSGRQSKRPKQARYTPYQIQRNPLAENAVWKQQLSCCAFQYQDISRVDRKKGQWPSEEKQRDDHDHLLRLLRTQNLTWRLLILAALYLVAFSLELLDPHELCSAAQLAVHYGFHYDLDDQARDELNPDMLLRMCGGVLTDRDNGRTQKVRFYRQSMEWYLQHHNIAPEHIRPGLGHTLWAITCLAALDAMDETFLVLPWTAAPIVDSDASGHCPFLWYAVTFFNIHYRHVPGGEANSALHRFLFKVLRTELELRMDEFPHSHHEWFINLALELCIIWNLDTLVEQYLKMGADTQRRGYFLPLPLAEIAELRSPGLVEVLRQAAETS